MAAMVLTACTPLRSDPTYRQLGDRVQFYETADDLFQPESALAGTALFPIALPVAYLALLGDLTVFFIDGLVINPPRFFWRGIPEGWRFLWAEPPVSSTPYRRAVEVSFKIVMTPVVLVAACFTHAFILGLGSDEEQRRREAREADEAVPASVTPLPSPDESPATPESPAEEVAP